MSEPTITCQCGEQVPDVGNSHYEGSRWLHYHTAEKGARIQPVDGGQAPKPQADRPARIDTRTEAQIQLAIRRTLETLGYHVSDLSQDRPTRQTPGIPDLFVMGHGRFAWAEIKRQTGRVSEHQQAWHEVALANGVPVHVWRSERDAVAWHEERQKEVA